MNRKKAPVDKEVAIDILVGLFVTLIFLALATFTIVVSGSTLFKDSQFTIEVVMPDAMGLRRNDFVISKGTTVGTVSDVFYARDGVHVVAELDAPVVFFEDYSITVVPTSILGGRQLVINEGTATRPRVDDVMKLEGEQPSDMMADATIAIAKLKNFLETDALENLRDFSEDLSEMSDRVNRGEGTLGKLLSENDEVYTNLNAAVASIRDIATRLEAGEGTLGKLLSSDDEVYTNLNATVANLRDITTRLEAGEGTLGKLLSADDEVYTNLNATVANLRDITTRLEAGEGTIGNLLSSDDEVYTNLNATVANLRDITDRLEAGEGTLGKLLSSDTGMYDNIDGAVTDVREMLDDAREASTLSTFSSLLFSGF